MCYWKEGTAFLYSSEVLNDCTTASQVFCWEDKNAIRISTNLRSLLIIYFDCGKLVSLSFLVLKLLCRYEYSLGWITLDLMGSALLILPIFSVFLLIRRLAPCWDLQFGFGFGQVFAVTSLWKGSLQISRKRPWGNVSLAVAFLYIIGHMCSTDKEGRFVVRSSLDSFGLGFGNCPKLLEIATLGGLVTLKEVIYWSLQG